MESKTNTKLIVNLPKYCNSELLINRIMDAAQRAKWLQPEIDYMIEDISWRDFDDIVAAASQYCEFIEET